MLFHPDFIEPQTIQTAAAYCKPTGIKAKKASPFPNSMQSNVNIGGPGSAVFSAVSPSPTRSAIKEANDHLQLLHKRVMDLEKTVQEQAEALIRKDELMQVKLRELAEAKDGHIGELKRCIENYEQRIKGLEQQQREKEQQLEQLSQKYGTVEDLDSCVPALEKLLVSLKKFPTRHVNAPSTNNVSPSVLNNSLGSGSVAVGRAAGGGGGASSSRSARKMLRASSTKSMTSADRYRDLHLHPLHHVNSVHPEHHFHPHSDMAIDRPLTATPTPLSAGQTPFGGGAGAVLGVQAMADMRIGRSFNINSNFSMSEDEDDDVDKYS